MIRNIILDLDETLIHSLYPEDFDPENSHFKNFNYKHMDKDFVVFERPYLQEFLDFLFDNFNVSVWTAASRVYALFIIKKFITHKRRRKLDYILFNYHCDISSSYNDDVCHKDLRMLDVFGMPGYNNKNTLIIDDHIDVYDFQPTCTIKAHPFKVLNKKSAKDTYLKRLKESMKELINRKN